MNTVYTVKCLRPRMSSIWWSCTHAYTHISIKHTIRVRANTCIRTHDLASIQVLYSKKQYRSAKKHLAYAFKTNYTVYLHVSVGSINVWMCLCVCVSLPHGGLDRDETKWIQKKHNEKRAATVS